MPYFIEKFHGHVIRVGPDAHAYGDPYTHAFFLTEDGEFVGQSSQPITISAVRTAIKAAESLGKKPFWRHHNKEKITMAHKHAHHEHKTKADGSLEQDAVKANLDSYMAAVKSGAVQILAIGEPLPVPGMPGVSAKTFLVKE